MSRRPRPLDVAIVGMACRFPGAGDLFAYWENLLAGRSAIGDVPAGRWDAGVFYDPDSDESDRVGGRRGGYLDEPIPFDAAANGIMPLTVEGGEPEQFLVLDAARSALADAGLPGGPEDGRRVEVVVGRGNYFNRGNLTRLQHGRVLAQTLAILRALHPEWSEADVEEVRADLKAKLPPFESATIPGQLTNATAGRVAHRLDLLGPCYVVDAASASSLVALDLGARSLAARRADLSIVGGIYVEADVDFPMVFSRLGVLSRSGEARPFSAGADGMVPGEGVGVVVLKRLADAERDGDRIYAVVKGVGIASDGNGRGLAAPDARGHLRAIRRAYRGSGIDPGTVGLIEGHGLGVPAADRAELKALRAAFPPVEKGPRRVLGAASALIGHAMPAAGMAGLIKSALALHHRILPASPGAEEPHPLIAREGSPVALNPASRPWVQGDGRPRRAGVNAFGFAGINGHAVLEEYTPTDAAPSPGALLRWPDEAILLAAPDRAGLIDRTRWLADRLRRRPEANLKDLAFTLNVEAAASGLPARLGLVVASVSDLIDRLEALAKRLADPACRSVRDGRGSYFWDQPLGASGGLAFLFPGEGSQYPGMLADLCFHFPEVRALFDSSDRTALESGAIEPPSERLFGATGQADPSLWESGTAVNVVLSSQWALYSLLRKLGLRPDAVAGHSSGEFLALSASGAVEFGRPLLEGFNQLAAMFGGLEAAGAVPTARLVAIAGHRDRVEAAFGPEAGEVSIAVDNCPHQVVLVGPDRPVEAVVARLKADGLACEDLPFARAYHTPAFAPALGPLRAFFGNLKIGLPASALYSCCSAARVPGDPEAIRGLAIEQWTQPVEFRRTIEAMHADGLRLFVDVGARGNLAGFVEDTLRGRPAFAVAANLPRRPGITQLNHLVASLFAHGVPLSPGFLYARRRPETLDLDELPPASRPGIGLKAGFPEMSLSEGLVERLLGKRVVAIPDVRPEVAESPAKLAFEPGSAEPEPDSGSAPSPAYSPEPAAPRVDWGGRLGEAAQSVAAGVGFAGRKPRPAPVLAPAVEAPVDAAMLSYLGTMRAFLETQRTVYGGFLQAGPQQFAPMPGVPAGPVPSLPRGAAMQAQASPSGSSAGPWAGEVQSLEPGRRVVAVIALDAEGDPVAQHHTFGGRRISKVNPELKGLPVLPFTVMAEMLVEAAARLMPGAAVVGMRDVRARRWVRYEDSPIALEVRAEVDPDRPGEVRAALYNRGPIGGKPEEDRPADVEGIIAFAPSRQEPPEATIGPLPEPDICRFTAESMYAEQWLFHGPALRAVVGVGSSSSHGIEGTLRVLPQGGLLRDPSGPRPLTDPIVLDAYTHLLGLWGLDRLPEGDVIFPLKLGGLEIFGEDPPEGTDLACRIAVRWVERQRLMVDSEIVRSDGRVWMRINEWEDWRFYWPSRYRDVLRQPDQVLLGEPMELPGCPGAVAVWLEPPADMGRPVWRDVLEQVQLSPEERAGCVRPTGPEERRTLRLWGRIAAKEAARRLWLAEGAQAIYPADLTIEPDANGRPLLHSRLEPGRQGLPAVSIAHTPSVAVALAAGTPNARVGIDVERVVERSESFERIAFTPRERELLDRLGAADRPAWGARLWCAKEAAAKATGLGLISGPPSVEIVDIDPEAGGMRVALGTELAAACPDLAGEPLRVATAIRGEYAWAWTVKEEPIR